MFIFAAIAGVHLWKTKDISISFANCKLAIFLAERVKALSATKSEAELASAVGYANAGMLRSLMNGESRVPLDKVAALASAIDVDVGWLMRMVAETYPGDLLAIVDLLLSYGTPTINELEILSVVQHASNHSDPKLSSRLEIRLADLFKAPVALP